MEDRRATLTRAMPMTPPPLGSSARRHRAYGSWGGGGKRYFCICSGVALADSRLFSYSACQTEQRDVGACIIGRGAWGKSKNFQYCALQKSGSIADTHQLSDETKDSRLNEQEVDTSGDSAKGESKRQAKLTHDVLLSRGANGEGLRIHGRGKDRGVLDEKERRIRGKN